MAQSVQLSDMHTVSVHHVCHDIGHRVSYGSLFSANGESQWTLTLSSLTTVSQQMLTAIKYVAGDNFVFSTIAHWHMMCATQSNCWSVNSQFYLFSLRRSP